MCSVWSFVCFRCDFCSGDQCFLLMFYVILPMCPCVLSDVFCIECELPGNTRCRKPSTNTGQENLPFKHGGTHASRQTCAEHSKSNVLLCYGAAWPKAARPNPASHHPQSEKRDRQPLNMKTSINTNPEANGGQGGHVPLDDTNV